MTREHLLDPDDFGGGRIIPSIAHSDARFKDQDYWRGRIWRPMKYLVWLGLGRSDTPTAKEARAMLNERSLELVLGEWRDTGHVHENSSAAGPDSDTSITTDWCYHWGAMLGMIGPGVDPAAAGMGEQRSR